MSVDPKRKLSWSRIELLHQCPQKYAYKYEENIVGGQVYEYETADCEKATLAYSYDYALAFGTAWHAALASIYDGTAFVPVHCPCVDTCEFCERLAFSDGPKEGFVNGRWMYKCIAQFLLYYPWEPDPVTEKRNARTRAVGVALIHAYLDKWKRESFDVVAVEQEFEIPFQTQKPYTPDSNVNVILETEFTYVGVIDLLTRRPEGISPWDHKTTSYFGEIFDKGFKLSGQFTGYIEATALCTNEPVASATANGTKVSKNVDEDSFARLETYRTPAEREAWYQSVRDDWDLIQLYRSRGRWPRHAPTSCFAFNRTCEYYSLCASGPCGQVNEDLKRSNYVKLPPRD